MSQNQTAGTGASSDGAQSNEPVRLSIVDRVVIPLVTAGLAFLASFVAANISNNGAVENQRAQIEEQRRKDDRDRRYDIYVAYLDAVIAFTPPLQEMIKCVRETTGNPWACASGLSNAAEPRAKLQTSFNRVVMYGSERVHAAARELYVAMLPFDNPIPTKSTSPPREIDVDVPKIPTHVGSPSAESLEFVFNNAYADFLSVVCSELPNIPRASC